MRIRRLELHGFKSFPDRTIFQFGSGIAGIVGPNGCGKSNVVDALRWCIGEQSARNLRGQSMEDVVFNGSAARPPVGVAEVSIVFSSEDRPFPGEWSRWDELRVTRRLVRGAASDYLINGERVRMRDIQDLLLDTGSSSPYYSVIEQGRIGEVVQATPLQRRALLEEAAGISRYKARRAETQERLAAAEENLAHSAHVVEELATRLDVLTKQVEKAARYRRFRAIVRQGLVLGSLARFTALVGDRKALLRQEREAGAELESRERLLARGKGELERLREEADLLDQGVGEIKDLLAELEARRRENESALQYLGREARTLQERAEGLKLEIEVAVGKAERAIAAREALALELQATITALERERAALARAGEEEVPRKARIRELTETMERHREARSSQVTAQLRAAARRESAARTLREVEEALTRHAQDTTKAREAVTELEGRRKEVEGLLDAAGTRVADARELLRRRREGTATAEATWRSLRDSARDAERALAASERERAMAQGRLDALRQLHASHAGLTDVSRRVLGRVPGSFSLSEELEVPESLQVELALALGERVNALGVEDDESLLKSSKEARDGQVVVVRARGDATEVTGGLQDALGGTLRARDGLRRLLGPVLAARDLGDALARLAELPADGSFLTPEGEMLSSRGVARLGRASKAGASLLGRKQAMTAAESALAAAEADLAAHRERSRALLAEQEAAQRAMDEAARERDAAQNLAREAELAHSELTLRRKSLDEAFAHATRRLGELGEARERQVRRMEELEREIAQRDAEARDASLAAQAAEALFLEAQEALRAANQEDQAASRVLAGIREEAARLAERARAGNVALARAGEEIEAARAREARARTDAEATAARGAAIAAQTAETETLLSGIAGQQADALVRLEASRIRAKEARERVRLREAEVEQLRTRRDEQGRIFEAAQARRQEVLAALEALKRESEELQGIHLPGLLDRLEKNGQLVLPTGLPDDERLPEGIGALPSIEDLVLSASLLADEAFLARWRATTEQARRRMDHLGDVNLAAMDEYREILERHTALEAERRDLEASVAEIRAAIVRINRTCRERFRDAFDRVDQGFRVLYRRLADGEAQLRLTDADDILDAGVEILAQPPGKRLQHLGLLSGGEKAVVAIALIFALFEVRPSPFCLLDEVDAPLDEANGARFNDLLREMSRMTQFIVITHRRTTMECVDTLYGVTMQDPGVSRLVAVKVC